MDTFISNVTAAKPLGRAGDRRVFSLPSGQYSNRVIVVYASSANTISLTFADPPYRSFSTPQTIVTDSADMPFDACMDETGNIHIAYIVGTNFNVAYVRLAIALGTWTAGTPATVFDSDDNSQPAIAVIDESTIGISFTRESSGTFYINYKESATGGASWGTLSDPGQTLTGGAASASGRLLTNSQLLYIFFTEGSSSLTYRRKNLISSTFESAVTLSTGTGFSNKLCPAANSDGRIGIAYEKNSQLAFREFSGTIWSAEFVISANACDLVSASYQGGIVYILFSLEVGTGMRLLYYSRQLEDTFSAPEPLDTRKAFLDRLLVYDESAGSILDRSSEARSTASADIVHPNIGGMIMAAGDSVFFGNSRPFHSLTFELSTAGTGGEVIWRYFDGQTWKSFTPQSGQWNLTTSHHDMLLWQDLQNLPADWQKKTIEGNALYWIAATVTQSYSTAPVGSQISAVTNLTLFSQV